MMSHIHKNSIITGYIDSYCLVCESYLRTEQDIIVHIEKPIHKKNLDCHQYLAKYKDEQIRKVKKGYFCEFCNMLLSTATKVGLHVAEAFHSNNKGTQLLKRVGNTVIAADVLINEKAWNGLIEYTCAICNTEFHNEDIHKTEQKHVLNLIEKKVEFGAQMNIIYRKIDDASFQCLTCNMIYAKSTLTTHCNDANHKKLYAKCRRTNPVDTQQNDETIFKETKSDINVTDKRASKNKVNIANENKLNSGSRNSIPHGTHTDSNSNEHKKVSHLEKTRFKTDKNPAKPNVSGATNTNVIKSPKEKILGNSSKGSKRIIKDDSKIHSNTSKSVITANTESIDSNKNELPKTINKYEKEKILENIIEFQKNGVNINFDTENAFCKKCFENVALNFETIESHIEKHKMKSNTLSTEKDIKTELINDKSNHNLTKNYQSLVTSKTKDADEDSSKHVPIISNENENHNVTAVAKPTIENVKPNEDPNTSQDDPASFAKANQLTYNKGNNNAYCRICDARIPSSLRNMKEHVGGAAHRNKVSKICIPSSSKPDIPKQPMKKFIKDSTIIESIFVSDVIVNDKICVSKLSFLMISKHISRLRCQACELNLTEYDLEDHVDSYTHDIAMDETPVILSLDTEFVREVRPGLFHCGFCNLIMGRWEDVTSHLHCDDHRRSKAYATSRLNDHMPDVLRHRRERQQQFLNMLMLGHMRIG